MTPETLTRAIEPFFTTKDTAKATYSARHRLRHVNQLGGVLRIESSPAR
jgi:hypothetical protein